MLHRPVYFYIKIYFRVYDMTKNQLWEKAKMLPLLPGVYIIRDKKEEIIYIGKAKKLRTRVSQYFKEGVPHDTKVMRMVNSAYNFDVITTHTEFEALVLECSQIKKHKPKYNILLKDGKGYSYIKISSEDWPRITAGFMSELDKTSTFLGPYMSGYIVHEMVETANDVFKLPRCTRRFPQDFGKGRPCLNAHINKCMAVCTGKIPHDVYEEAVDSAHKMLKRGRQEIVSILTERMEKAAERMDFERAAVTRDQIKALEKLSGGQKIIRSEIKEQDVLAFVGSGTATCAAILRFRDGALSDKREFVFHDSQDIVTLREEFLPQYYMGDDEDIPKSIAVDELPEGAVELERLFSETKGTGVKIYKPMRGDVLKLVDMAKTNATERLARESGRYAHEQKLLDELAFLLGIETPPEIIESYDISNWGDSTSVAGMVVFKSGKPHRAGYRRFKMEDIIQNDDYASIAQTLKRRAARFETEDTGQFAQKPDLFLIDGGRGQVSAAKKALSGTKLENVPLFGMVKDAKHRTRGLINDSGDEIVLAMHKGVFKLVTSIQDETHRFANDYRKRAQKSKTYSSTLQEVQGVGPSTSKALMAHFKTVAAVKTASVEQLQQVKGVSKTAAAAVYNYFNPQQ